MEFGLVANISDPELLMGLVHDAGTLFYQRLGKGIYNVIYFSRTRVVAFKGKLTKEQEERIKSIGYEVKEISIDFDTGMVEIKQ
ncbi:MAG: hypothetical protein DRN14_04110 [Thermoplasmata archaeon]|nr:MAG: hypothetical protein DRN14_04110 [Thermoplasmata archaeon]